MNAESNDSSMVLLFCGWLITESTRVSGVPLRKVAKHLTDLEEPHRRALSGCQHSD